MPAPRGRIEDKAEGVHSRIELFFGNSSAATECFKCKAIGHTISPILRVNPMSISFISSVRLVRNVVRHPQAGRTPLAGSLATWTSTKTGAGFSG